LRSRRGWVAGWVRQAFPLQRRPDWRWRGGASNPVVW